MNVRHALVGLVLVDAACRRAPPAATTVAVPSDRDVLLARIRALDEVAPCLVDGGAAPIVIVDAELAGDAATVTFACANGGAQGKVTFFRIGETWTVSTKEIRARAP